MKRVFNFMKGISVGSVIGAAAAASFIFTMKFIGRRM